MGRRILGVSSNDDVFRSRDDEETDAAEPPSIQLYKFEDFESTPTPTNDDTNADKNTSE